MSMAQELVEKRFNRAIAVILGAKEREIDAYLRLGGPEGVEASSRFRKAVLDQLNDLRELTLDLMGSEAGDGVVNELFLEKLDAIHQVVVNGSR